MNGNPFYVQPGAEIPFEGLTRALEIGRERREQRKTSEARQAVRMEAAKAFEAGDHEQISKLVIQNPELREDFDSLYKWQNERTKQNAIDSAIKIIQNPQEAEQILADRIGVLSEEGGDPSESAYLASEASRGNTELAVKEAWSLLAQYEPQTFDRLRKLEGVEKPVPMQKTGSFYVRDPQGNVSIATGVFDPMSGNLKTATADIPGFEVVSAIGETAREQTVRRVGEARGKEVVKGEERRASDLIDRGILAAESTAQLRRGIDLLQKVETGGVAAVANTVKRIFGIESADEGELSNSLAKAVLSQLRETFGAQFTEAEGKRLERIEAAFRKSPAANKRLLQQTLRIAERTARRARKAAEKRGDVETVADIDDLLTFDLTPIQPEVNEKGWPLREDEDGNKAYVNPNNPNEMLWTTRART